MAVQNIVPVNEMPALVNEVVTVTTSETDNIPIAIANPTVPLITDNGTILNVSNTQEVTTSENENKPTDIQISQPPILQTPTVPLTMTTATTPPKILHAPNNQFVQVKPPTTTSARIQTPNVKNFFIRKGIEKQPAQNQPIVSSPPTAGTFITTQATPSPVNQLSANKKIIIKSQQILVPASKQNVGHQIIQLPSGQSVNVSATSTPVTTINANVIESPSSSGDLSGILDLPILFADNNSDATVQSGQIITTTTSPQTILFNTVASDRNAQIGSQAHTNISNIFINATDGKPNKLPNRPVVISAAKITKPLQQQQQQIQTTTITTTPTPTSNKLIFINRNQIGRQQIVGTPTSSHTQIVKGLPTLKLMPTSLASSSVTSSPAITLQGNQITKLSPGTKIDLSTLKFVKNTSPIQGGIVKPLIINKAVPGTKNAILIKSPITGGNVQGNVLNRNITVRKVMNVVPNVKQVTNSPVTISNVLTSASSPPSAAAIAAAKSISTAIITNKSPTIAQAPAPAPATATNAVAAPTRSPSPQKTTRKTRNSN